MRNPSSSEDTLAPVLQAGHGQGCTSKGIEEAAGGVWGSSRGPWIALGVVYQAVKTKGERNVTPTKDQVSK